MTASFFSVGMKSWCKYHLYKVIVCIVASSFSLLYSDCGAIASTTELMVVSENSKEANRLEHNGELVVEVVATGYTAGKESTGKNPEHPAYGITYSGVKVIRSHVSTVAADPAIFPIGTLLYIPNYGYGVVADTGKAIKGKRIDLYFDTVDDVYSQWGKRTVQVQVLKRGTGKLSQALVNQLNDAVEVNKPIPLIFLES